MELARTIPMINERIQDDCEVCKQYEEAQTKIHGVLCPWCNHNLFPDDPYENLKPGDKPNLSTRMEDIMEWSREQFGELVEGGKPN